MREHVFDGIEEYDQKLPNWWLFTLWITVVFFAFYWIAAFQFGWLPTDEERIDPKVAAIRQQQNEVMLKMLNDENLWKMSRDPITVSEGKQVYQETCMGCHGQNLGGPNEQPGLLGLPLNDDEWKYGGNPKYIYQTVNNGSPDPSKGMVAWGPMLGPEKVAKVTAYILSKHDTMPVQEPVEKPAESPVGTTVGIDPDNGAATVDGDLQSLASIGKTVFATYCVACHGPDGKGMPNNMAPSLVGSELLTGPSERAAMILLDGIQAEGKFTGVMVSWKAILTDEQIAGVLTHSRSHFGNSAGPITPDQVSYARDKYQNIVAPHRRVDLEKITTELPAQ